MASTLLFLTAALPLFAQRYNEVQMKAAHNSEQRTETLPRSLECDETQPWQSCCLGIELDLSQDPKYFGENDYWQWAITHDGYDWKLATLYSDLMILRNWHDQPGNEAHEVVTIFLDPKDAFGKPEHFIEKLDEQLKATLGEVNLYKPGDLQGPDLTQTLLAAAKKGWPEMNDLRGKFIVVITGTDEGDVGKFRDAYAEPAVHSGFPPDVVRKRYTRMAFVDLRDQLSNDGNRVFVNVDNRRQDWCELVKDAREAKGYVTRAWQENTQETWQAALDAGVNLLATNMIRNKEFASVGGQYRTMPLPSKLKCP